MISYCVFPQGNPVVFCSYPNPDPKRPSLHD